MFWTFRDIDDLINYSGCRYSPKGHAEQVPGTHEEQGWHVIISYLN